MQKNKPFDGDIHRPRSGDDLGRELRGRGSSQGEVRSMGPMPHPDFDPLSYILAHPETDFSDLDPVRHFAARPGTTLPPPLSSLFPGLDLHPYHASKSDSNLSEHDACTTKQSRRFALAETVSFAHNGNRYELKAPPAEAFRDRILSGEGFVFYKHPHGFWTCMRILNKAMHELRERLGTNTVSERELCNGAARLAWQLLENTPFRNLFIHNFMHDLAGYVRSPLRGNVWRGVAFKGYPTLDGRLFVFPDQDAENNDICRQQLDAFAECIAPSEELIDGTVMKRWVVSGGIKEFPTWIRDNPVAVVGPVWFSSLGSRMRLADFTLIRIAHTDSFAARFDILRRIRAFLDEKSGRKHPPVVLFHCGGSLACWLIFRLFPKYPRSLLLDFGQALLAWLLDEPWYGLTWKEIYLKAMIENMGLENLYRELAGPHYEPWLESAAEAIP
ncbi:hypothetical protein [Pseudodesulfovibrio indicus]|uniref:Uncharacterized protein n=1 Tax=Pseudodesulfovibrio indicus TaxID=1716143 RepID=A0A126QJA5_9BACT|nr:hypothetical protein [Pseudodesulfovibrio indicus]AMK10072.1 hypothetical protein AWY79_02545 [Pseudodesulfovibrio indicus]TDT86959.1 hypothetical protein EDC59_11040 [Pseudodesulfovibrio indicus]